MKAMWYKKLIVVYVWWRVDTLEDQSTGVKQFKTLMLILRQWHWRREVKEKCKNEKNREESMDMEGRKIRGKEAREKERKERKKVKRTVRSEWNDQIKKKGIRTDGYERIYFVDK